MLNPNRYIRGILNRYWLLLNIYTPSSGIFFVILLMYRNTCFDISVHLFYQYYEMVKSNQPYHFVFLFYTTIRFFDSYYRPLYLQK
jgi:hypothetical protein